MKQQIIMEKKTLVLYPSPAIGHLISMVELGKLILKHHPSFSITILITTQPYNAGSTGPYLDRVSRTTPSIHFHHLPTINSPIDSSNSPHHETLMFGLLRFNNPLVHQALQAISQASAIKALIIDFFCTVVLEVSNELKIPTYFFFTSGANFLAAFLYMKTIHRSTRESLKDMNRYVQVPGIPPLLASDMAKPLLDREDKAYEGMFGFPTHVHESKGIIINSFESLEPRTLKALRDGLCLQDAETPPIYCIGPLIADRDGGGAAVHECLSWLESQPSQSVVFLCFGSLGMFSAAQLREIATGLETSAQRFLWVVRNPPTEDKPNHHSAPQDPDLNRLLPEGFLERTKDRGLVIKSWAPQVEVLSCESVGGFVTHCGWNSVLEAVCAGVPMVAWPLYAEQRTNRVYMVEELKIAVPMEESKDGFVSSGEVEKRVRQLMDSEEGRAMRERTKRASEWAKAAMSDGGSSLESLRVLTDLWSN